MSITKRLDQVRATGRGHGITATQGDQHRSHATTGAEHQPKIGSQYIGEFVYGGLDGIITTFAVVSGVVGANLNAGIILVLGLANLLADGFSMATGSYLSTKSEQEYYRKQRAQEQRDVEQFPERKKQELYEIYRRKGHSEANAHQLTELVSRRKEHWIDALMVNERGLTEDDRNPLWNGVATLVAFLVAGAVPLLVYLVGLLIPIAPQTAFIISVVLSGMALWGLGAAKVLVTGQQPLRSGAEMFLVGSLAASVAYVIGALLGGLGGV